ncbi:MAG: redoxin family protein [Alphaproteobacteria bacterium]|nr:redoxin family protein [Alphaproteobacteria bacterium]
MTLVLASLIACAGQTATASAATAEVGKPAPDFTLPDLDGKEVTLSSFKGKTVVLEWFNPGCPFVVAAHEGGPLEAMASKQPEGVVWLAVNSGAPGKQGHGVEANREAAAKWKIEHPILLDEKGTVGKQYGATNTPQMVVIDGEGVVQYWGALDNAPRNDSSGNKRVDYTGSAIQAVLAGETPKPDSTKPWGCSVKY